MWKRALGFCWVLIVALGGCKSTRETGAFEPREMQLAGTYVHTGSGIAFPERAAGFERVAPKQYDAEAKDVGIGYRRVWGDASLAYRAEATLFVFPAPRTAVGRAMSPDEQFESEVRALARGKYQLREIRRMVTDASFRGQTVTVRAAEFAFVADAAMGNLPMVTLVAGFPFGEWRVSYRATLPPPRREATLGAFETLLSELGLPATGLPGAAAVDR